MSKIKWLKIVKQLFLCFFIICLLVYIHEVSHCLTARLMGGQCYEIGFNTDEFYAYATIWCDTIECWRTTLIAGTFIGVTVAIIINIYSRKKLQEGLYLGSYMYIMSEFTYMIASPFMEKGDFYWLYRLTPEIDITTVTICLSIMWVYLFIDFILKYKEMCEKLCLKKLILKRN